MVDVPAATELAETFALPMLLIVATLLSEEVHEACAVMSWLLPSLYIPVAVNTCEVPLAIADVEGSTSICVSCTPAVPEELDEPDPPHPGIVIEMNDSSTTTKLAAQ